MLYVLDATITLCLMLVLPEAAVVAFLEPKCGGSSRSHRRNQHAIVSSEMRRDRQSQHLKRPDHSQKQRHKDVSLCGISHEIIDSSVNGLERASTNAMPSSSIPPSSDPSFMLTTSSFGDIMQTKTSRDIGNSTTITANGMGHLQRDFGIYHALDRIALTANGNLQRLVASYYDAPVTVVVDSCTMRRAPQDTVPNDNGNDGVDFDGSVSSFFQSSVSHGKQVDNGITVNGLATTTSTTTSNHAFTCQANVLSTWDRRVQLQVYDQTFCTATSVITIHDAACHDLVATGRVGLGQLFRHYDILPTFVLHRAWSTSSLPSISSSMRQTDPERLPHQPHVNGVGTENDNDCTPESNYANVLSTLTNNGNDAISDDSGNGGGGGGGGFEREYTLQCALLTCRIHERFVPGMWTLRPR